MVNKVKVQRSNVPGRRPTTAQLGAGELAVNQADKKLFFGTGDAVVELFNATASQAALTVSRSTSLSVTTAAQNITFDQQQLMSDVDVLSHSTTVTPERLRVNQSGMYIVMFRGEVIETNTSNSETLLTQVNGVVQPQMTVVTSSRSTRMGIASVAPFNLNAGDYLSFTIQRASSSGTGTLQPGFSVSVARVSGVRGEPGLLGSSNTFRLYSSMLDSPSGADWPIGSFAPPQLDPANAALQVRSFDDTAEEGVAFQFTVPAGASSIQLDLKLRPSSAPAQSRQAVFRIFYRSIPDQGAVTAWQNITMPAVTLSNALYKYSSFQTLLSSLGITPGSFCQFVLSRNASSAGDTLLGDVLLLELAVGFA